ncbi:hypothetical protein GOV12_03475, partial [Candidatus Pacearchaeota archaeon]|nr:hypothetical protein [Candidatus Pacearchaeota archaeon]
VSKVIPQIQEIYNSKKNDLFAEIFKGPEGMKAVWDDILNYDAIYWIGSGMYVPDKFPAYWNDWNKRRLKKKIKSFHLCRHEKRKFFTKKLFPDSRSLPIEFSGNPTAIAIYGNKVAQMLLGEHLNVFVIESKELAENYKKYHKYLWDNIAKA